MTSTFYMDIRPHLPRTLLIGIVALLVYALMAGHLLFKQSIAPHFAYLAEAWLDGHSNLDEPLPSTYDLIQYNGIWYVAQPPLPALLMLPITALRDAARTPEVLVSVLLGALNVALCDLTLALWLPTLSSRRRAWLTLFFALGTAHGYMSALSTVWFLGQIAAVTCLWAVLVGIHRWPLLVGLGLGGLALSRPTALLGMLVLVAGMGWLHHRRTAQSSYVGAGMAYIAPLPLMLMVMPLLVSLAFLAWYNQTRFGSPSDFGYGHVLDAPNIRERRLEHGSFSPAFLPDNLYTATIRPPLWEDSKPQPDAWGMGLLWLSPVLLYAVGGTWRERATQLLACSVGLIMLFPLTYHNSGSAQFGYRFILDSLPVLMLLVGQGAQRGPEKLLGGVALWSVALHLWGFWWIYELLTGQTWHW